MLFIVEVESERRNYCNVFPSHWLMEKIKREQSRSILLKEKQEENNG